MNKSQNAKETAWVGLDVDSKFVFAAVDQPLRPGAERVRPSQLPVNRFPRTPEGVAEMLAWAAAVAQPGAELRIVMESTGCYSEDVHRWLCETAPGTGPVIMNPKIMKDFLASLDPRTKSDRVDSQGIARFGTDRTPTATPLLSKVDRKIRELMRLREMYVAQRDAQRNHLASTRDAACVKILECTIKNLQAQIDRTLREALKTARKDKAKAADLSRIMEVFGVAEITALTIIAELGDLRRFKNSKQLASYCGLTPKIVESGGRSQRPRMSKFGNAGVRRVLFMAALINIRHKKTDMAEWYEGAVKRGMAPHNALVRVMRKLLDRIYLMVTSTRPYERKPSRNAAHLVEVL